MRKLLAALSRSTFLRRGAKSLRVHHAANAFLGRWPIVRTLPASGIVYRASRLESVPLGVDMLERTALYPIDVLPSPLTSFADLGCNVGYFTCWLAHHKGRALKGLMVDANPDVIKEAQWHVEVNGLKSVYVVHGLAGSDRPSAEFFLYDSNVCSASQPLNKALPELEGEWRKITVPTLNIAELWRERFGEMPCDLLKLDVEGSELRFVQLETAFLSRVKVIIAEWHAWGTTKGRLADELQRQGFRLGKTLDETPTMGTAVFFRP